jgi:multidrug efflux pump subunit AcrB
MIAQALREQNVQGAAGQVGTPPVFNGQQQTLTINGLGRLNEAPALARLSVRSGARGQLVRLPTWRPLSWARAATAPARS